MFLAPTKKFLIELQGSDSRLRLFGSLLCQLV